MTTDVSGNRGASDAATAPPPDPPKMTTFLFHQLCLCRSAMTRRQSCTLKAERVSVSV